MKILAFSNIKCPECSEDMLQVLEVRSGGTQPPHLSMIGGPYCDDCHPNLETPFPLSLPTWDLLPQAEREVIIETLLEVTQKLSSDCRYNTMQKLEKQLALHDDAVDLRMRLVGKRLVKRPRVVQELLDQR